MQRRLLREPRQVGRAHLGVNFQASPFLTHGPTKLCPNHHIFPARRWEKQLLVSKVVQHPLPHPAGPQRPKKLRAARTTLPLIHLVANVVDLGQIPRQVVMVRTPNDAQNLPRPAPSSRHPRLAPAASPIWARHVFLALADWVERPYVLRTQYRHKVERKPQPRHLPLRRYQLKTRRNLLSMYLRTAIRQPSVRIPAVSVRQWQPSPKSGPYPPCSLLRLPV
jgi:hypothetical protein